MRSAESRLQKFRLERPFLDRSLEPFLLVLDRFGKSCLPDCRHVSNTGQSLARCRPHLVVKQRAISPVG
jgi:hypothetical protein